MIVKYDCILIALSTKYLPQNRVQPFHSLQIIRLDTTKHIPITIVTKESFHSPSELTRRYVNIFELFLSVYYEHPLVMGHAATRTTHGLMAPLWFPLNGQLTENTLL